MPPDINNPKTFGDYYWAGEVEAKKAFAEQHEQALKGSVSAFFDGMGFNDLIPPEMAEMFSQLKDPKEPSWDDLQRMFLGTVSRGVALAGGEQMAKPFEYQAAIKYQQTRVTPEVAIGLMQRRKIDENFYEGRMQSGGYSADEAFHLYNSTMPFPSIPELIRYSRYNTDAENPQVGVLDRFDVPLMDFDMWEWLSRQKLSTEQVQAVYRRGGWDKARSTLELSRLGWPLDEREMLIELSYQLPNAMLLVQGDLLQQVSRADIIEDIAKAGIHPIYADKYFDGILTKPNTQDLIAWQLRLDPSLKGLDDELEKTGVHPDYFDVYKTLAHPIPPINDLITMAVREAFTPAIASRFGQYEGLPSEFVDAAEKKGLSKEWSERYWAAHWTLPSVGQGFDMLHRGIIDTGDLDLLMRALDIMPFWRDRLMQLSFKPLTRVDVRRMHLLGTLDKAGVTRAYLDVGYNDKNAALMTDFTIKYNQRSLSGFTPRDAMSAYINQYIDSSKASSILRDIGVKGAEIPNMIKLATYKRDWKYNTERIQAIGNLYKKGKYDKARALSSLSQLGLESAFISTQLEQWEPSSEAEREATFTNAQTLKLFTMGLIDEARAIQELELLGFDEERRNLLIRSVKEETD